MRVSSLERKLLFAVLLLFLLPTAVAEVILIVLHRRGAFQDPAALLVTTLAGLLAMALYLSVVTHGLGRSLVRTIQDIRHGAELMATVNPGHRIRVGTGDELQELADEINGLADHVREARFGFDTRVADATRDLEDERAKLAEVLGQLSEGVVVASLDGQITLANRAAQDLLSGGAGLLGRSLFEFAAREQIVPSIARLRVGRGEAEPVDLASNTGAPLQSRISAYRDGGQRMTGLILAIRGASTAESPGLPPSGSGPVSALCFVGAGLTSGVSAHAPSAARPGFYDFSLLNEVERHILPEALRHDLMKATFVVLDVETTGLSPETGDRVVSLAGVRVRACEVKRKEIFDALVQPERQIPPASTKFHGITDTTVAGAPRIERVLPAFARFAGDAILVGHEVSFDLCFLEGDARRLGMRVLGATHGVLDTSLLSRVVHGSAPEHSLEALAARLGVTVQGRHSALGDALATAEILVRLLKLLERRGICTLGQALTAVQSVRLGT